MSVFAIRLFLSISHYLGEKYVQPFTQRLCGDFVVDRGKLFTVMAPAMVAKEKRTLNRSQTSATSYEISLSSQEPVARSMITIGQDVSEPIHFYGRERW